MRGGLATRRASFWVAVGGVALMAQFTLRVAADKLGDHLPALKTFVNYINHSEGA